MRRASPRRPAIALALVVVSGVVAAADPIQVPGGTAAISRLLGHVDTGADAFAASLNRALLRRIHGHHDEPLAPDRRLLLAYLAEVRELRRRLRPPIELSREADGSLPTEFLELAAFLGYVRRDGAWVAPQDDSGTGALKRRVAAALDLDPGAIAYTLERGGTVRIDVPVDSVAAPLQLDRWRALTGQQIDAGNALEALIGDQRLGLWLEGLRRADADLGGVMGQDGLRRLYSEGSLPFYRYASSIRLDGGELQTPGGSAAFGVWRKLVGTAPDQPREFLFRLLRDADSRGAHLWQALTFAPQAARDALLADDRRGAALREPWLEYVDRIHRAEGAGLLSTGIGGDFSVSTLLRSLPTAAAAAVDDAGPWLERRGLQEPCVGEQRLRRITRKSKRRDVSESRFLGHLLGDTTPLHGGLGLLFQPFIETQELFHGREELRTPSTVLLLRRAAAYRPLVLEALHALPMADGSALAALLSTAERLDCVEPSERRDPLSLTFQGGLELVAALRRGGQLDDATGTRLVEEWVALHRDVDVVAPPIDWTVRQVDWLSDALGTLPAAPADAPGRGPLERRLLASLAGSAELQTFHAQGLVYRARRGRDLATAMERYLGSQSVASPDRLRELAARLEEAEQAVRERDGLKLRLVIRSVEALVAPLEIPTEARVAGLEHPEFAAAVQHRLRAVEQLGGRWREPGPIDEGTIGRTRAALLELLDRELRALFCALAYLKPIALLEDPRFDQPLFVLRHTATREIDPQGAAPMSFPSAWNETAVVPAAFAPAGSHLAGAIVHVPRALVRHHALTLAPQRPAHTWPRVRSWWSTALESGWADSRREAFRVAAELMAAGDAAIEAATAGPGTLPPEFTTALRRIVPPRRFADARDSGSPAAVGPGDRLQAGLLVFETTEDPAALLEARKRLGATVPRGSDPRQALRTLGVPSPRLNGAWHSRIGDWPAYEALEREASVDALRERQLVDVWFAVVEWVARRDLPPRVGYDVLLRVLEDLPGRVRLETERDWEAVARFAAAMDDRYLEGRLRACLIRGLYTADSL